MKIFLSIAAIFFSLLSFSQNFQPGYFINNEGTKFDVLIDNIEAIRNPEGFRYKLSPNDEIKVQTIRDVQTFEILDSPYKYERAIVDLELTKDNIKLLDANREPTFRQDTLFLKVSIEGKASLYLYQSNSLPIRFFYSVDHTKIEPLIFKRYLVDGTIIKKNNRFKQQLFNNLQCSILSEEQFLNLSYSEKSLNNIFTKYHNCEDINFENFFKKSRKGELNFLLKAGINYSSINITQERFSKREQRIDPYISPRIGIEIEYNIPVLNNKFSIISYPSFQYNKTSHKTLIYKPGGSPSNPGSPAGEIAELPIDFSRIILPIGLRAYYYQGKNIDLYLQGALVFNVLTNPSGAYNLENFQSTFRFDDTSADPNLDFSTGIKYRKFSLDVIYSLPTFIRNLNIISEIQTPITLNLGYKIF